MHEHAVAQDIVRRALEEVPVHGRVTSLRVLLGEDEHINPETLSWAVSAVSANTAAQGAALRVRQIPGRGVLLETVEIREGVKCASRRREG